jgi:hypothetical protein
MRNQVFVYSTIYTRNNTILLPSHLPTYEGFFWDARERLSASIISHFVMEMREEVVHGMINT